MKDKLKDLNIDDNCQSDLVDISNNEDSLSDEEFESIQRLNHPQRELRQEILPISQYMRKKDPMKTISSDVEFDPKDILRLLNRQSSSLSRTYANLNKLEDFIFEKFAESPFSISLDDLLKIHGIVAKRERITQEFYIKLMTMGLKLSQFDYTIKKDEEKTRKHEEKSTDDSMVRLNNQFKQTLRELIREKADEKQNEIKED